MVDTIITLVIFAGLAIAGLVLLGLLILWGSVVARLVGWLAPRPRKIDPPP